jgi:hypothetical protein
MKDYTPVDWENPGTWVSISIALLVAGILPLLVVATHKEESESPKPAASSTPAPTEKKCDLLLGNLNKITPGEDLYIDSQCNDHFGLIMGVTDDGSKVQVLRDSDKQLELDDRDSVNRGYFKH